MTYLELFFSFLQIGMFSIGGGYAAIPLIQSQAVDIHGWLTMSEFTDLVTIAEMTPGPIAVNSATFVGIQVAGFPGALIATLGCIFPSLIIVSLLAYIYYKYKGLTYLDSILATLRCAVVALIAGAGISILQVVAFGDHNTSSTGAVNWVGLLLFGGALVALIKFKTSPILTMVACGVLNLGLAQII